MESINAESGIGIAAASKDVDALLNCIHERVDEGANLMRGNALERTEVCACDRKIDVRHFGMSGMISMCAPNPFSKTDS